MSGQIHVTTPHPGVVMLQIDNPPANALGTAIRTMFMAKLDEVEQDLKIRAVIITGTGRSFCAGDDLREAATRGTDAQASLGQFACLLDRIEGFRTPVIAAINGYALGGGLELALACDLRVGCPASTFTAAGVNVGLIASVYRLPRLIGVARAKAMLLTGSPTDAERALEWGLITELFAPTELIANALGIAERIATRAPLSVEAAKRQAGKAFDLSPEEARRSTGQEAATLVVSNDHRAAVAAFAKKESPTFTRS